MKEKKPINLEIGQNVKQIRENAGLTQERLAELIGLGVKHLSAIECGAVGVSLATLKQLCVLLSVPADAILFGIESVIVRRSGAPPSNFLRIASPICLTLISGLQKKF